MPYVRFILLESATRQFGVELVEILMIVIVSRRLVQVAGLDISKGIRITILDYPGVSWLKLS